MKLKKLTAILLTTVMAVGTLAGCGGGGDGKKSSSASSGEDGGIREYTAFFAVPERRSTMTM